MGSLSKSELVALLNSHLHGAVSATELEDDQADAQDYYHGRPFGNEVTGQSQVVTRDVLETIEWMKPSLMRIFASGKRVVEFSPVGPEDEAAAEQETDIINHVITQDNDWFSTVYAWIHDALLQKVGYVKVYWDETEKTRRKTLEGLDDAQLAAELENGTPVEHSERLVVVDPMMPPMVVHDVTIEYSETEGRVRIEPIPPDEVRVSANATALSLRDVEFVAHTRAVTKSWLVERGVDKSVIDSLEGDDAFGDLENARSEYEDSETASNDEALRKVEVHECYALIDRDGSGIARRHRILYSGSEILEDDEWDEVPIIALSPIPQPHTHIGLSEADLVMDVQEIRSTLLRQILNNLYLTNNPEKEVVWDNVMNADSMLVSAPGGIKPVKALGTINPLTVPFTAGASLPIMELLDSMKEVRTGISRHTQGLDADALAQSTKGAFMGAIKQANQRLELIARIFAETGFRDLFRLVHKTILEHQDKPRWLKLRNKWVPVDVSEWRERDDMTVVVGAGTGNDDEQLAKLMTLAQKQEQHLQMGSPMVSMQNLYNTYTQIVEKSDLKDVTRYFTDPKEIKPKQPQPSESDKMIQAQMQIEQLNAQIKQMSEAMKKQSEDAKLALQREKLSADYQLRLRDLERKEVEAGYKLGTERTEQELKYGMNVPGAVV